MPALLLVHHVAAPAPHVRHTSTELWLFSWAVTLIMSSWKPCFSPQEEAKDDDEAGTVTKTADGGFIKDGVTYRSALSQGSLA